MLLAIPAGKASCLLLRHKNWSQQITGLTPDKSTPLETPETNDVISTKRERCLNTTHWTQLPELLRTKHPKVHVHFKGVDAPALHDRLIGQERACCSPSARSSPHADAGHLTRPLLCTGEGDTVEWRRNLQAPPQTSGTTSFRQRLSLAVMQQPHKDLALPSDPPRDQHPPTSPASPAECCCLGSAPCCP